MMFVINGAFTFTLNQRECKEPASPQLFSFIEVNYSFIRICGNISNLTAQTSVIKTEGVAP